MSVFPSSRNKKCCSLLKLTLFALHNETGVGKFVYQKSFGKREPEIKSLNNCGNINWTSLNYFIALSIDSWGKNISCFPTRTDLNIASRRRDEYFLETTRTWYEFKWLFFWCFWELGWILWAAMLMEDHCLSVCLQIRLLAFIVDFFQSNICINQIYSLNTSLTFCCSQKGMQRECF